MYQAVMSNQAATDVHEEAAKQLNLDLAQLTSDMDSPELKELIKQNQDLMNEFNVKDTPTFFVNTQRHEGAKGLSRVVFEQINLGGRQKRMAR